MFGDLRLGEEVLGEVLSESETAGREVELDGDLGVHTAEQILGDGSTFGFIGVEECPTRVTADDRAKLPTQVERVLDAEVHTDTAGDQLTGAMPAQMWKLWYGVGLTSLVRRMNCSAIPRASNNSSGRGNTVPARGIGSTSRRSNTSTDAPVRAISQHVAAIKVIRFNQQYVL